MDATIETIPILPPPGPAPPVAGRYRVDADRPWVIDYAPSLYSVSYGRGSGAVAGVGVLAQGPPAGYLFRVRRGIDWYHAVGWQLVSAIVCDWTLRAEGARHRMGRALGAREPQVGDPEFDRRVWIAEGDEAQIISVLDAGTRSLLADLIVEGAVLERGRLHHTSNRGWTLHALLPRLCALLDALRAAACSSLVVRLKDRVGHDPLPAVRVRALAHLLRVTEGRAEVDVPPEMREQALIGLLDDDRHRLWAIAQLAQCGGPRSIGPLSAFAGQWFERPGKAEARAAIEAIIARVGEVAAGALTVVDGDGGRLSFGDEP